VPPAQLPGARPGALTAAVVNGRGQTVLAGSPADVEAGEQVLAAQRIACTRLRTSGAFHTPLMAGAAIQVEHALAGLQCRRPTLPLYSAAAGGLVPDDEAALPAFWVAQVAVPVRFARALDALLGEPGWRGLEGGPADALTALMRRHPERTAGSRTVR